jgi:hypothetical protein
MEWPSLVGDLPPVPAGAQVTHLGASIGTSGHLRVALERLAVLESRSRLVVELPTELVTSRSLWERIRDRHRALPDKLVSLLTRHPEWCVGAALNALGGSRLTNPIAPAEAIELLRTAGAREVRERPTERGTTLVIAEFDG